MTSQSLTLKFSHTYASISSFPDIILPSFAMITGLNGVGKSHLLQAIHNRNIVSIHNNSMEIPSGAIRILTWNDIFPSEYGSFSSEAARAERQNLLSVVVNLKASSHLLDPVRNVASGHNFLPKHLEDPLQISAMSDEELLPYLTRGIGPLEFRSQLDAASTNFYRHLTSTTDNTTRAHLTTISKFSGRSIPALREEDILSLAIPLWGSTDIFQQSFGRLFVAYRDALLGNKIAKIHLEEGVDATHLSQAEFFERYGPPPWDFVNDCIRNAGLDFSINKPHLLDYINFTPMLTKNSTNVVIPFSSLSSGEKVLISFSFCVYYALDGRQISNKPMLLLLDEIDAVLHPSMSKMLIKTLTESIVEHFGISVIATTHSPSTIALCPDESIFCMKTNSPGLHKISKAQALNILTQDVPTLSISYDGRRQVFVESETDAFIYSKIYSMVKSEINSGRSLEFIATGTKSANGTDTNSGCEILKKIVNQLVEAGNSSVFGLIDWDGKNTPTPRIRVLAHSQRDGLENVLFDPLLIGLAIWRDFPKHRVLLGIDPQASFVDAKYLSRSQMQAIADLVSKDIFGDPPQNKISSSYSGGLNIDIDSRYLDTDDHHLEKLILNAYPFLIEKARSHSKLTVYIVDFVLNDHRNFIPQLLFDAFNDILTQDGHI